MSAYPVVSPNGEVGGGGEGKEEGDVEKGEGLCEGDFLILFMHFYADQ